MATKEDEAFFSKLLATFQIEAEEHLKALSDGLLELEGDLKQDQRQQVIENIFRETHSLKGASQAVNKLVIHEICQQLENVLSLLKKNKLSTSPFFFNILHEAIAFVKNELAQPQDKEVIHSIVKKIKALLVEKEIPSQDNLKIDIVDPASIPNQTVHVPENKIQATDKTVRVSLSKLDRLFQEAEEMLMVKLMVQQEKSNLKDFLQDATSKEKTLKELSSEIQQLSFKNGSSSDNNLKEKMELYFNLQAKNSNNYLEKINKLIKQSDQGNNFIKPIIETLIEDSKKILMQPISTLFEGMPLMIRAITQELKKEVQVKFQGGEIEIDRRILEELKDPLIHLIRNAIDHGIEKPEERTKKNKPSTGTVTITASETSGNNIELSISDDGKGIDIERLKATAIKQNYISVNEAAAMSDKDALKLAFCSGLSTSPTVSELSGRGLGLGIVSEKTEKLGGRISVDSALNQGTTYTITLPLSLATFRGIHITVSDQDFIMPAHNVKHIFQVKKKDIKTIENNETITIEDRPLSYVHLGDLLDLKKATKKPQDNGSLFIIILTSQDQTIAFGADAIHSEREVLVKGLGSLCVRVKNIIAATIFEQGQVLPILNPADLIRSVIKGKSSNVHTTEKNDKLVKKRILLAEDSITTRLLMKNILESAGYNILTSIDGLEALELLQKEKVDLIITDIEMPRMDGFSLIKNIKKIMTLEHLPIIICSTHASDEDREHGVTVGANGYINKSNFTQQGLLNIVQKLL